MLLLAWKMRAKRMGYFSRDEFQTGVQLPLCSGIRAFRRFHKAVAQGSFWRHPDAMSL